MDTEKTEPELDQDRVEEIAFAIPRMAAKVDKPARDLAREMADRGMITPQEHTAILERWREQKG